MKPTVNNRHMQGSGLVDDTVDVMERRGPGWTLKREGIGTYSWLVKTTDRAR